VPARDRPDLAAAARRLSTHEAGGLLAAVYEASGQGLDDWKVRNVHQRDDSVSAVYACRATDGHESLVIAHVSRRGVPDGATVLSDGDVDVHVWTFPFDPYLPGLPSATAPARVRELLDEVGGPPGEVSLYTVSYRPSRRAVVEVTVRGDAGGRVLYLKVMGGRDTGRVRARTERLADLHRRLGDVLPVPRLVGSAPHQGIVAMTALGGRTLRSILEHGGTLPEPADIVAVSDELASTDVAADTDPRGFADPVRHVELLAGLVPDRAADVRRIAQVAAGLDGPEVGVHGDLHDGQLLITDGAITGLLDIDGVGMGLLAHDAGSLVAHVEAAGDVRPEVGDLSRTYADELAQLYAERVGMDAVAAGAAAAWIGLATGPFRAQEPGWQDTTRRWIDHADRWLRRSA
jgi:hypothetical protein